MVPNDPQETTATWSAIIEAAALFDVLTTDGQNHFRQAADTPFVTGLITTKLGPFDDNDHSDAILQGTFNANPLTDIPEVRDIIKGM
jgi:hypothetical protein